jgi:hypothetical protein
MLNPSESCGGFFYGVQTPSHARSGSTVVGRMTSASCRTGTSRRRSSRHTIAPRVRCGVTPRSPGTSGGLDGGSRVRPRNPAEWRPEDQHGAGSAGLEGSLHARNARGAPGCHRSLAVCVAVAAAPGVRDATYAAIDTISCSVRLATMSFISCADAPCRVPCWISQSCRTM